MIEHDPALEELWRIKEQIAARFETVHELAEDIRRFTKTHPLPKPGKHRKLIPNFPRGQSVGDPDPTLEELRRVKEALAAKYNYDIHALAESFRNSPTWTPVKKPARPLSTAKKRLKRITKEA